MNQSICIIQKKIDLTRILSIKIKFKTKKKLLFSKKRRKLRNWSLSVSFIVISGNTRTYCKKIIIIDKANRTKLKEEKKYIHQNDNLNII